VIPDLYVLLRECR